MHPPEVRRRARALLDAGSSLTSVSKELGVSRSALRDWCAHGWSGATRAPATCFRCQASPTAPPDGSAYAHPRYFFTNLSADTRALCCDALDRLGTSHTHPRERDTSVARRGAVALLDEHVGPKI